MKVIKGHGAPTVVTIGYVNDLYVDLDTNDTYRCTNIETLGEEWGGVTLYSSGLDNTMYTWERVGGSSGADVFNVTISSSTGGSGVNTTAECDKTYEEIFAAFESGALIVCTMNMGGGFGPIRTTNVHYNENNALTFVGTASSITMGELNPYVYTFIFSVQRGDTYQWRYCKMSADS